jgi:hypothetical protein
VLLCLQPGVVAIGLVLNITHDRRAAFESFMETQGRPNTKILDPSLLKTPAASRPAYLPAAYAIISPALSPIYNDRIQNMDMLPIPCVPLETSCSFVFLDQVFVHSVLALAVDLAPPCSRILQ